MGDKSSRHFDLKALLMMGDLDIRMVSKSNASMQAGEYFKLLSKFINRAPLALEALNNAAANKTGEYDIINLRDIKFFLDGIGHGKFLPDIDVIINASKMGHNKFAADNAKKLIQEFNGLYTRIMSTQKTQELETPSSVPDENSPVYENYEAQLLKKVLQELDHEEETRKMMILAVDDSSATLKTISSILGSDYKVYGMLNPKNVEEFLKKLTPELFLLDIKMPELSGFDLIPIIRRFENHKNTPIIFLTAVGTADNVSSALALGVCDYIVKPFQEENLREKVAKHIVRKKLF